MKLFILSYLGLISLVASAQTYQEKAVAAVLMGEAWSEGVFGMTAVAEVIHERTMEKGLDPLQIISAHRGRFHAFSCVNGTTLDRLISKFSRESDYPQALRIARIACQTPSQLPGLSRSANYFTRATECPYWAKGNQPVAVIGRHAFYRLKQ
ncbi:MAG: cell wall hydrolase [Verrucomicrobiota bacterium]|jgi:spore germination cell wall hydrolase CwlJ-like protein